MKYLLVFVLILNLNWALGQNSVTKTLQLKTVEGVLLDRDSQPMLGVTISILGTPYFALTDFDGKFCLQVPEQKSVFISVSCCYEPLILKLKEQVDKIEIDLGSKKIRRKSKKLSKIYSKQQPTYQEELNRFYSHFEDLQRQMTCEI